MKYMTLIRGDAEIIYPIYEMSDIPDTTLRLTEFETSDGIKVLAHAFTANNLPAGIQSVFTDELPDAPDSYGSITQTKFLYELDTASQKFYCPEAHFLTIPIGERPSDWDTNFFDYYLYQTGQVGNWGNVPVATYPATDPRQIPEWSTSAQYYKNNTDDLHQRFNHLFFTKANYSFGVWTMCGQGEGDAAYRHYSLAASNPRSILFNDQDSYLWRDRNGTQMSHDGLSSDMLFGQWRAGMTYLYPADYPDSPTFDEIPLTQSRRDMYIFCCCEYNDTMYYGIAGIVSNNSGAWVVGRTMLFTIDFWGDSISDYNPEGSGEWGEDSTSGGGNGTFQVTQDDLSPSDVSIGVRRDRFNDAFNNGGTNVYQILTSDFGTIASILYGDDFWDKYKNAMFNPLSAIIACHLLPSNLLGPVLTGRDKHLTLAGYDVSARMTTPINFPIISSMQRYLVGSFDFNNPRYSDSFTDFAPNTIAILHLPYIGECEIDINAFMYGSLILEYICDNVSGNCAAWVWNKDRNGHGRLKYVFTGNCASNIPLYSMSQDGSAVGRVAAQAIIGIGAIALGVGLTAATGGTGAGALALGGVAKRIGARTLASAAVGGLALGATKAATDGLSAAQHLQSTGGVSGNAGALGDFDAWLEIIRPVWSNPSEYQALNGIPSNTSTKLSECSGFTQVASIEIENCTATTEEIEELKSILENGIIIKRQV